MLTTIYGTRIIENTYELLKASDISEYLKPHFQVAIKPNLIHAQPASEGATTHPEVVEGIILYLKDNGVKDIKIIESSWVGGNTRKAFKVCGYEALSKKYGIPLIDLKSDSCTRLGRAGIEMDICNAALESDFLINVPVLKAHCQTNLTCCMKNLKGCIPDSEKRRFHTLGIHKPVAVLNLLLRTGYNIVDGICGDLTFEEGGTPVEANRLIAGRDPLTVDSYCAGLIGYQPEEIEYITYGAKLGVGMMFTQETKVVELNAAEKPVSTEKSKRLAGRYRGIVREDAACSACYSALMYALHRKGGSKAEIHIGQGFKGKGGDGIGIGRCACGFQRNVPGCPPKAVDILAALNG
jgi:uncharacterized protein (DUF362 family)